MALSPEDLERLGSDYSGLIDHLDAFAADATVPSHIQHMLKCASERLTKDLEPMSALRTLAMRLETKWGVVPILILSCAGGSDEHFQVWHPNDRRPKPRGNSRNSVPVYVVHPDGKVERHPDSTRED